jgi:membrane associated rhomboid family serine protease
MIPIYDDNPTRRLTWLTIALVLVNVAVFVYETTLSAEELSHLIGTWAFVPAAFFADPTSPHQLITILTAAFIHGGWLHLGGNMLYLWVFGNNIEDSFGGWRFVLFYACAAAVATFAQAASDPGSTVPLVGASGAVAGVLGAYVVLYPGVRVMTLVPIFFYLELAAIPAVFTIGFWFALQLIQGLESIGGTALGGGVAWWAHVGGFVFGLTVAAPLALARMNRSRRGRVAASRKA